MWAAFCNMTAEAFAEAMAGNRPEPEAPGSGRLRNYICRACLVHGKGTDDGLLTCWCCDSNEHIDFDKVPGPNGHTWSARDRDGNPVETVGSLVG